MTNFLTLTSYLGLLKQNIDIDQELLDILGNEAETGQDPNWRLAQGELLGKITIYKDLCRLAGVDVDSDFYPDTFGLLNDTPETSCT